MDKRKMGSKHWLIAPIVVMNQPTRRTYIGAGERLPPLRTLHGDTVRAAPVRPRVEAAVAGPLATSSMSAGRLREHEARRGSVATTASGVSTRSADPPRALRPCQ